MMMIMTVSHKLSQKYIDDDEYEYERLKEESDDFLGYYRVWIDWWLFITVDSDMVYVMIVKKNSSHHEDELCVWWI